MRGTLASALLHSNLLASKNRPSVLCERSRVDCIHLQNGNSLGQDRCVIISMLEVACRDIGESHIVITVTRPPDLTRVLGSYSIPALNSTQNYVLPQKESTSDLECDCDIFMYRYASV